jgi:UDP-glucose 4-epimerase
LKAVVTGSSGFIGRPLVTALEKAGFSLITIDYADNCDITSIMDLAACFEGEQKGDIEVIFHLAAKMFVPDSWDTPRAMYDTNLTGTLNVLEQARLFDIKKFVFASSYVYGNAEYLPIDEKHPVKPANPYTHSKYLAEELARSYYEDYGISCIVLRPFNVYGPGQSEKFLIPTIINQLDSGRIELKDPEPKRDFLFVADMVDAYLKAAEISSSGFEIFNIGYGKSHAVSEVVDMILELSGKKVPVNYTGERRDGEVMEVVADITKAKEKLDWEPEIDLKAGIKRILDQ